MVVAAVPEARFDLSDEELVERWSENVVWQFFSGMDYYEPRLPCDATQIGRFRRVLGEAGVEQLLKATIEAAVAIGRGQDSRVRARHRRHHGAGEGHRHPTDSRLLEIARHKVVRPPSVRASRSSRPSSERASAAPQGRRLCARQAVQAPAQDGQAPAHDPRHRAAMRSLAASMARLQTDAADQHQLMHL